MWRPVIRCVTVRDLHFDRVRTASFNGPRDQFLKRFPRGFPSPCFKFEPNRRTQLGRMGQDWGVPREWGHRHTGSVLIASFKWPRDCLVRIMSCYSPRDCAQLGRMGASRVNGGISTLIVSGNGFSDVAAVALGMVRSKKSSSLTTYWSESTLSSR